MEISSRLILILVLLGLTHVLSAQTYKVIRFGLKDSLSVGSVNDISQDSTGFIWVASDHGLHRYNGNYFVTVHRDSITFLRFQQSGLTAAGRTVFNFKTKYPFDEISFESLPIKSGRPFRNGSLLVNDSFGWWWADEAGIHNYHNNARRDFSTPQTNSEFIFAEVGSSILAIEKSGRFYSLSSTKNALVPMIGTPHGRVNDAITYSDSSVVVATDNNLLLLTIRNSNVKSTQVLLDGEGFKEVVRDKSGNIWAATTGDRLLKFYPANETFVMRQIHDGTEPHRVTDLQFPSINRLFVDRHNNVWVCHKKGLALIGEIPFVVVDPSLPNEIIRSVAFMDEGKAYLSGVAGFFETVDKGFNDYEVRPAKLGKKNVYPIAICKCGDKLWLGTVNDELYYYANGKISDPLYENDAVNIFFLYCDSAGDVWILRGQKDRKLTGILKITDDLKLKRYDESFGFSTRMLVAKEDSHGNLFVAGIGDSTYLYRYDRENEKFINVSASTRFDYGANFEVHDFVVGKDSTFWLGTTIGLLALKDDSIRRVNVDELYGKEVVAVTFAKDGILWAATEKDGLIRYVSDSDYAVFNVQAGLQSGIMWYRSLFVDQEGKLWAGSREGITVSSQPSPQPRKTETPVLLSLINDGVNNLRKHVFNFESSLRFDFAALNYPTRSIEYQYKINNDSIWTGLRQRNELVLPEMEAGNYTLFLRARQTGGFYWSEPLKYSFTILQPWYLSKEAFLLYAIAAISMVATGMRVYNRRLIREKHRLEEKVIERTQELIRKQEEVIAQNQELHQLSDVLAANNENIIAQKEIIEKQNLLLHQAKNELEKKVEERTNELKIANEELAQQNVQLEQFAFMTAHNLRAPVARLLGLTSLLEMNEIRDRQESELLKRIKDSSQSLDDTIREISQILHIKKGFHGSFTAVKLKSVWERMASTLTHEIEGNGIELDAGFSDSHVVRGVEPFVYSVLYNLLSNGIKYADSRKKSYIHVSVVEKEHELLVIFEDNGIGFNSAKYADKLFKPFTRFNNQREGRGLGLYLMKIQMEMMGGSIQLVSQIDEGTKITLQFVRDAASAH
jgi:signal transduction histidine kinase/ligand-binding sensor domain-containing protein